MAEWIGNLLGQVPDWLFLPAFIVTAIVIIMGGIAWAAPNTWTTPSKRAYLGEKKHGKK